MKKKAPFLCMLGAGCYGLCLILSRVAAVPAFIMGFLSGASAAVALFAVILAFLPQRFYDAVREKKNAFFGRGPKA